MAKTTLNTEGESSAHALIRAGHYDSTSAWSFDAEDGNKLLGPKGDDWAKYGRWHLGEDPSEPADTKAHWKYPYGKDGKVYRRAVAAIRQRASQGGDDTIFEAAGKLMSAMDDEDGKQEKSGMSGLRQILGSRFGHFAAAHAAPTAAKPAEEQDEEAKRTAAAKAEEEEEMRKGAAEKKREEEDARRARRSRRARKGRAAKDGDDDDDAADDGEDEEDEEEMKRAAAAGHDFALEAAFRAGARAQRRRCAKIFDSKAAAADTGLACSLAFETPMTAVAAIAILDKTPAPKSALADRMALSGAGNVRVGPGAPEAPGGQAAVASSWDHALKQFAPN